MSGRPRLVHEGSPEVVDEDFHQFATSEQINDAPTETTTPAAAEAEKKVHHTLASLAAAKKTAGGATTSKPYKLQTKLVIGDEENELADLDMSIDVDEDEHDDHHHNQHNNDMEANYSTSNYYGSHGHVYHGHYMQHQQQQSTGQNQSAFAPEQVHAQPNYGAQTNQNGFNNGHNHNYAHVNSFEHAPPANPAPAMYKQPDPSTSPLVVLDAANIAYAYSDSRNPILGSRQRRQPDPRGIRLAIEYFLKRNCRVQAVVPISWYQLKPRPGDHYHLQNRTRGDSDAKMVTDEVEELRNLRQQGFLVACPAGDDDDAYVLALAKMEDERLLEQHDSVQHQQDEAMGMEDDTTTQQHVPDSVLGGYVVSNDMFYDAIRRDEKKQRKHHQHPLNARPLSLKSWLKQKRISYSFANVGTTSDGDIRLNFLPNPRNELIEALS